MITLLRNAQVFTAEEEQPYAEAVAYENERLIYVGKDDPKEWGRLVGEEARIVDLGGKFVLPGFIDSHIHPAAVAMSNWHIKVPMFERAGELLAYIKAYAADHPKEEIPFLYFEYYPTNMFSADGPTKELLDTAVSDRPCLCQDFGDHMHWVNSKMLELMEVDARTPDPVPGLEMFVRDEEGNPTGWVKERAWMSFADKMYEKIGWKPPEEITEKSLGTVLNFFKENGITALFDAVVESEEQLSVLRAMDDGGRLKLYYDGAVRFRSFADLPEKIAVLREYQRKYGSRHIKLQTMKLFLDGTNESGNGAYLEPHINDPSEANYGEIKMEEEELKRCFLLCNEEGLDVHLHIVGDRAFRTGWKAAAAAKKEAAARGKEWVSQIVFAHCELVDPADMEKPAQLGIRVNWSCHWSGGYFGDDAKHFISEEKWNNMYQFNPMLAAGTQVAFSSDVITYYELDRANPFFGIQVANTRIDPQFPLDPEVYPGSVRPPENGRLSLEVLLRGYTIAGAEQLHWEEIMGSLKPGKLANLCIVSENPFSVEPGKIKDIEFHSVVFEGEVIWGRLSDGNTDSHQGGVI
ncbi:amidohydrolase family protein [Anaerovorax odorimutans]|uniref:Amidohydrolase family protein n=1 Tax=Anaerovorax odorimutans TaxID=109327 RepID=A0ABT1RLY7_9FIRM|nr:amidohydrolase family protein [Anaerovorax odorimutans]MCQ4636201.1 amidohydrolase family protein [Anaerovorax odorimutans]